MTGGKFEVWELHLEEGRRFGIPHEERRARHGLPDMDTRRGGVVMVGEGHGGKQAGV